MYVEMEEMWLLAQAASVDEWLLMLKALTLKLGYTNFLIGLKSGIDADTQNAQIFADYPEKWRQRYDEYSYADIDPVVQHCLMSNRPLIWDKHDFTLPEETAFFEEAELYGLGQGLALPLHSPNGEAGMLCLKPSEQGGKGKRLILQTVSSASLLRDYAMEGMRAAKLNITQSPVYLTPRETEVLNWSAVGKTTWEIAMILACTTDGIEFHFKNIRKKFQVNSRRLAVIMAIKYRLINP